MRAGTVRRHFVGEDERLAGVRSSPGEIPLITAEAVVFRVANRFTTDPSLNGPVRADESRRRGVPVTRSALLAAFAPVLVISFSVWICGIPLAVGVVIILAVGPFSLRAENVPVLVRLRMAVPFST